jgi:hypothetical protein
MTHAIAVTPSRSSGRTYIRKLRASCHTSDPLLLQVRLVTALSTAGLRSPTLGPHAILCVRSFADPLPHSLRLDSAGAPPPTEWRTAAARALDELARRAARPGHDGVVSSNTAAVLFADLAELLVCLSTDWLAGEVANRWWWRAIFGTHHSATTLVANAWLSNPAFVPAAVDELARQGRVVAALCALSRGDSRELLRRIVLTFGLASLAAALEIPHAAARPARDGAITPVHGGRAPLGASFTPRNVETASPLSEVAVEIGYPDALNLHPEGRILLAVALLLHRAPSRVRTPAFARYISEWYIQQRDSGPFASASGLAVLPPFADSVIAHPQDFSGPTNTAASTSAYSPRPPFAVSETNVAGPGKSAPETRASAHAYSQRARRDGPQTRWGPRFSTPSQRSAVGPLSGAVEDMPVAQWPTLRMHPHDSGPRTLAFVDAVEPLAPPATLPLSAPEPETIASTHIAAADAAPPEDAQLAPPLDFIETRLGGLFYLINVALSLGLYPDFAEPDAPALDLSLWDFLFLLAQRLVGGMRGDPVWRLLAQLAGRTARADPIVFDPPRDWRIPARWLEPFPEEGIWYWSSVQRRLTVFHPAGFYILDATLTDCDSSRALLEACYAYRAVSRFELRYSRGLSFRLYLSRAGLACRNQWLDRLAEYVRARLRRAFGTGVGDPVKLLMQHRARVVTTGTQVAVVLSLETLPLEIRRAGLDRDPGWVPAGGRFVTFEFESSGEMIA